MDALLSDVRWTLRLIRHRPGFALAVIATVAAAIAGVTSAFGVATAVLWRPLPFGEPDRLVFVWENPARDGAVAPSRVTGSRFTQWRARAASVDSMAVFGAAGFTVERADGAVNLRGVRVSTNYFDTLRIAPALGRTFVPADGEPGNERVTILSHALWQEWFGEERSVLGQQLRLSGQPYTIVGVMPPVVFPAWPVNPAAVTLDPAARRIWVPIPRTAALAGNTRAHVMGVVARLAPGRSLEDAARELNAMADPSAADPHGAVVLPFRDQFAHDARTPLLALLGAALAVLLVACTNLAALQGSATESRRAELALRAALGAGRMRLARQFAIEAATLAGAGWAIGLALSRWALARIPDLLPPSVPLLTRPALDPPTVLFAAGASVCAALALAAWPLARTSALAAPAPRGVVAVARGAAFRSLVVLQVAMAIALVASAALLQRSLDTLRHQDPGFVVDRVLVGNVTFAGPAYARADQLVAAERRLSADLARMPGARAVAFALRPSPRGELVGSLSDSGSAHGRRRRRSGRAPDRQPVLLRHDGRPDSRRTRTDRAGRPRGAGRGSRERGVRAPAVGNAGPEPCDPQRHAAAHLVGPPSAVRFRGRGDRRRRAVQRP